MNFYIMNRDGIFTPSQHTENQCKAQGHMHYEYKCKIVFDPQTKLDENQFLIDHTEVDKAIMSSFLAGSCENMHKNMMETLLNTLANEGIKVLAVKLTIKPVYPVGLAELSYAHVAKPQYFALIN